MVAAYWNHVDPFHPENLIGPISCRHQVTRETTAQDHRNKGKRPAHPIRIHSNAVVAT
jgi:hypothetical protein